MKILNLILFSLLLISPTSAQNVVVKGFITDIKETTVIVNAAGKNRTIILDKGTTVKESRKNVFRDPTVYQHSDLCLALPVKVRCFVINVDRVVAVTILIDGRKLEQAKILNSRIKPVEVVNAKQEEEIKIVAAATSKTSAELDEVESIVDVTRKEVSKLAINFASLNDVVNGLTLKLADDDILVEKYNLNLYFPSASAKLKVQHHVALELLTKTLLAEPNYIIEVRGYASTDGNTYANKYLSNERAAAVKETLILAYNVPLRNITSFGFGAFTDEDPAKARKVVVVVYGRP